MFFLQADELQSLNNFEATVSEFVFQGQIFVKLLSFTKNSRQKAIETCRNELDAGRLSILIESSNDLTVWIEKPQPEVIPEQTSQMPSEIEAVNSTLFPSLTPEFLSRCHQEFINIVGPIGNYIINKILSKNPQITSTELVQSLIAKIPDSQLAQQFQNALIRT